MIEAFLHGKLSRKQTNMEDLLTSCFFGLLMLDKPSDGLFQFLADAIDPFGEPSHPLRMLQEAEFDDANVKYMFWPKWDEPGCRACEPDLVLEIENSHSRIVVVVEAKYKSPKSSFGDITKDMPNDQLAREWDNLFELENRRSDGLFLVYLTADVGVPRNEIRDSIEDCKRFRKSSVRPKILALSWRQAGPCLAGSSINQKLNQFMTHLGLTYFCGVHVPEVSPIKWTFDGLLSSWEIKNRSINWSWSSNE